MPAVDLTLHLQRASDAPELPSEDQFARWAAAALRGQRGATAELTIRLVDELEGAELNRRYRGKDGPTNVLSFPFEPPPGLPAELPLLGDLVVCAPLVPREAAELGKPVAAHWALLVVHGVLHLIGYDHQAEAEATEMAAVESVILHELGFDDPYAEPKSIDDERSI